MSTAATMEGIALLADVGGTNARFALAAPDGSLVKRDTVPTGAHPTFLDAAQAFLDGMSVKAAALAVAAAFGPKDDTVTLTNHPWTLKRSTLRAALHLDHLAVVNDFSALAHALPAFGPGDVDTIRAGTAAEAEPMLVLGPGTGLGCGILVPSDRGALAVPSEGGHMSVAACTDEEAMVLAHLRHALGTISAEMVVSGPGLLRVHNALAAVRGADSPAADPAAVTARAAAQDTLARDAVAMMTGFLGTVAGDLSLATKARGGVYLAGGVLAQPVVREALSTGPFITRFHTKPPHASWMQAIPIHCITHPTPAFLGLSSLLGSMDKTANHRS